MRKCSLFLTGLVIASGTLAGCATESEMLTTASTTPQSEIAARCRSLASQIESLKTEGTVGRVEKAAEGNTRSVTVKRAALAKVAELNNAYEAYRTNCSKPEFAKRPPSSATPKPTTTASVSPAQTSASTPAAASAGSQ